MAGVNFQIKNRFSGGAMFECELPESLRKQSAGRQLGYAIKEALKADAYLAGAYLADAYLADADLAGANLADAKNVPETNGSEAAEERIEDRKERYAKRAAKFRERNPDVPVIESLDAKILGVLDSGAGRLNMSAWHTCETTHCMAGWAIHLAGEPGHALEAKYGPHIAGRMIFTASTGHTPHFFASDEQALIDLRERAALSS